MFMYAGPHISLCTIVNSLNRRERLFFLAGWVGRNWQAGRKDQLMNRNLIELLHLQVLKGKTKRKTKDSFSFTVIE